MFGSCDDPLDTNSLARSVGTPDPRFEHLSDSSCVPMHAMMMARLHVRPCIQLSDGTGRKMQPDFRQQLLETRVGLEHVEIGFNVNVKQ